MKILLTGGSGFLGKVVKASLVDYMVTTISKSNADIRLNLSTTIPQLKGTYDTVIHLAGKAHVMPKTLEEKQTFFKVNVDGTYNLLMGLDKVLSLPRSFIYVSSVSVYGKETGKEITEDSLLGASDAYGQSKIQAEKLIQSWCEKNNVICTILRLPLIAGPNPPGNLGSMINGIQKGYYFNIDGGKAKKSIVLAEDIARIIPKAAEVGGIFNLTDGYHPSFKELSSIIAKQLGKKPPGNIPGLLAKGVAKIGDMLGKRAPINSDKLKKITSDLTFDDSKAREMLGWNPTPVLEGFKIS